MVNLTVNSKGHTKTIHRLVMLTFKGYSKSQVNHIDGNKLNNNLNNLEYCNNRENYFHARKKNLLTINTILTEEKVLEIRELLKNGLSHRKIAKLYGVGKSTIGAIYRRESWTHI